MLTLENTAGVEALPQGGTKKGALAFKDPFQTKTLIHSAVPST